MKIKCELFYLIVDDRMCGWIRWLVIVRHDWRNVNILSIIISLINIWVDLFCWDIRSTVCRSVKLIWMWNTVFMSVILLVVYIFILIVIYTHLTCSDALISYMIRLLIVVLNLIRIHSSSGCIQLKISLMLWWNFLIRTHLIVHR